MEDLTAQSWFWWAVALVVGAPIVLVILSEVGDWLVARGSAFARPMRFLRSVVLPVGWLLLLLVKVAGDSGEDSTVRIVATALSFCAMLFALALVNAGLFASAERTSWRSRLPSIFIDLARLLLIVIGTAILLSVVWGANIGGLSSPRSGSPRSSSGSRSRTRSATSSPVCCSCSSSRSDSATG